MCHPRRTKRLGQDLAYPETIREPAQHPQPDMAHLSTATHLKLQHRTAVSHLHHTGALLTAITGVYFTAHNRRSEGHSRVKPATPTTNPVKNWG